MSFPGVKYHGLKCINSVITHQAISSCWKLPHISSFHDGGYSSYLSCSYRKSSSLSSDSKPSNICSKLSFIGGGKMAEAMIHALTVKGVQSPGNIYVFDVHENRLEYLREKYGVLTTSSIEDAADNSDAIILAVKPQNVATVAAMLSTWKPNENQLLLSIVAGCTLKNLESSFQSITIVRSMPNTPAMVLEGMTVWTAAKSSSDVTISLAKKILRSIGEEIEVSDENYLDMATAVSGSGPAYVFLTMEAMIDAAVHVGFPRDTATKLVTSTIRGSATYAMQSGDNIPSLRNNVTSPGGTTASALYELERGGFRTVVADAIWAAYRRALELGGTDSNVGPGRNKYNK